MHHCKTSIQCFLTAFLPQMSDLQHGLEVVLSKPAPPPVCFTSISPINLVQFWHLLHRGHKLTQFLNTKRFSYLIDSIYHEQIHCVLPCHYFSIRSSPNCIVFNVFMWSIFLKSEYSLKTCCFNMTKFLSDPK